MIATISAVSFFILAALAIVQLGASPHPQKLALRVDNAEGPDNFLLNKARAAATGDKYLVGDHEPPGDGRALLLVVCRHLEGRSITVSTTRLCRTDGP